MLVFGSLNCDGYIKNFKIDSYIKKLHIGQKLTKIKKFHSMKIDEFLSEQNEKKPEKENHSIELRIVTHSTVYPLEDQVYLPTFSSRSIETILHLIPNLTDRYLYLNNDKIVPYITDHPTSHYMYIYCNNKILRSQFNYNHKEGFKYSALNKEISEIITLIQNI